MKKVVTSLIGLLIVLTACKDTSNKNGQPVANENQSYYGPIIDMHIHAFSDGNPLFGMTHPRTLRGKTYEGVKTPLEQKEKTLEKFREHTIVKAVVTNGTLWDDNNSETIIIAEANNNIDTLRKQYNSGQLKVIAEMAPFYEGMMADDPSLMPIYQLAEELDIPVGVHILPGGPNAGFHLMPEMLGGMRVYNANPLQLEAILVRFPNIKLYIMHGGWPYVEDVKALMYAHPNLYVDTAVLNWILPQQEFHSCLQALINAGFENRILFGTDQMAWPETIDDAVASVNAAEFLTWEQKENIFYDNAAASLNLSNSEIQKHKKLNSNQN